MAVGVLLCALTVFSVLRTPEPRFEGRPLSQWLKAYSRSSHQDRESADSLKAAEAIAVIGTNAIPWLLKNIQREQPSSGIRAAIFHTLLKLPGPSGPEWLEDWATGGVVWAERAALAFDVVGSNAAPAIPFLFSIATNESRGYVAHRATRALAGIGPVALPQLLQIITNPIAPARFEAITPLGFFTNGTSNILPVLLHCLHDPANDISYAAASGLCRLEIPAPIRISALLEALRVENPYARATAAQGLAALGPAAIEAVPHLKTALTDTNAYVRIESTNALLAIAPDTLTNATPQ